MKKRVLFIDTTHPALPSLLVEAGFFCDHFYGNSIKELFDLLPLYHGVIVRSKFKIDEAFLKKATSLEFIGRVGAGLENIDMEYAQALGINCFNAPEGNRDAVAEHAIGMLLSLNNHLFKIDQQVRNGIWLREENRGTEISGKTVGIIGFGNMGQAFAKRLMGFDCKVLSYDKYKFGFGNDLVEEASMDQIYSEADIVSLHIPLTTETNYLCNESWFGNFKKEIALINTSRGKIVNTKHLVNALKNGKVRGACLDVLEYEKFSFENLESSNLPEDFAYLIGSDQVILSPHVAGWTHESNYKLAKVIVDKIKTHYQKKTPLDNIFNV